MPWPYNGADNFFFSRHSPAILPCTTTAPQITSRKELERWLEDKPVEWARVLALRAAMRVLPIAVSHRQGRATEVYRALLTAYTAARTADLDVYYAAEGAASTLNKTNPITTPMRPHIEKIPRQIRLAYQAISGAIEEIPPLYNKDSRIFWSEAIVAGARATAASFHEIVGSGFSTLKINEISWEALNSDVKIINGDTNHNALIMHQLYDTNSKSYRHMLYI